MTSLVVQRLFDAVVVLFIVTLAAFFILRLTGDPVDLMVDANTTREQRDELRHSLGLDRPLHEQYFQFVANAVRGDLGRSIRYASPTLPIALNRMPATVELTLAAMAIALVVGIPAGIVSAVHRNSAVDYIVRLAALLGQAIPFFWLAIMLILLFSVQLQILPTSGRGDLSHLILPAFTLSTVPMARVTRLLRSSLLSVLQEDYITVARAKGLSGLRVITRHSMKNALMPAITDTGLQFGLLLSGAIIAETIFSWPGMGRLAIDSIASRDYPMVQALVMINAFIFVSLNLVADLTYVYLDPRLRFGGQSR